MYMFLFLFTNILGPQLTLKDALLTKKGKPLLCDIDFSDKYSNL